jgi:hypothetical protein
MISRSTVGCEEWVQFPSPYDAIMFIFDILLSAGKLCYHYDVRIKSK